MLPLCTDYLYATSDQQIRLRFSRYTEEIIENDMFLFGERKENTFINKIIRNYYPDARASIHMRLEEYRNALSEVILKSAPNSHSNHFVNASAENEKSHDQSRGNHVLSRVLKTFTENEKDRLLALADSYKAQDKGCKSKPYRLQNEIYHEFTDESSGFREEI